jgi:hypothetical protein
MNALQEKGGAWDNKMETNQSAASNKSSSSMSSVTWNTGDPAEVRHWCCFVSFHRPAGGKSHTTERCALWLKLSGNNQRESASQACNMCYPNKR